MARWTWGNFAFEVYTRQVFVLTCTLNTTQWYCESHHRSCSPLTVCDVTLSKKHRWVCGVGFERSSQTHEWAKPLSSQVAFRKKKKKTSGIKYCGGVWLIKLTGRFGPDVVWHHLLWFRTHPCPVTRHSSWNASFTEGAEEFYHGKINWMEYCSRAGHQPSSFYDAVPPPSGVSERSLTSEDPTGAEMIAGVEDLLLDSHSSFATPLPATLSFPSLQRKTHTANELEPCDEGGSPADEALR